MDESKFCVIFVGGHKSEPKFCVTFPGGDVAEPELPAAGGPISGG